LLADWELSEFELELQTGVAPEIGVTRSEDEEGFTFEWEVTPLETQIFKSPAVQEQEDNLSNPAGQTTPVPTGQVGTPGEGAAPFLQVELRVLWFEAGNERSVTRTIFAVDEDAAAQLAAVSVLTEDGVGRELQ
jgi:hypothetical protein